MEKHILSPVSSAFMIMIVACSSERLRERPSSTDAQIPHADASSHSEACGDGVRGIEEECDFMAFVERDCSMVSYLFVDGRVTCSADCRVDFSGCQVRTSDCGNGRIEPGEGCDDSNRESGDGCSRDCLSEAGDQALLEPPWEVRELGGSAIFGSPVCSSSWGAYTADQTLLEIMIRPRICRVGSPPTAVVSDAGVDAQIAHLNIVYSGARLRFVRGATDHINDPSECEVDYLTGGRHLARYALPTELSVFYARNVFGGPFSIGGFATMQGAVINASAASLNHILAHEVGHFLGLDHPHACYHGIETATNCTSAGDQLCSTPADPGPAGVNNLDRCSDGSIKNGECSVGPMCSSVSCPRGENPDVTNVMSYYHCGDNLTGEQNVVTRCVARNEQAARVRMASSPPDSDFTTTYYLMFTQ